MSVTGFLAGVALGIGGCALAAAVAARWAYRRFVVLEREARENQRLAELGTLTGGLAHELKNPLSTIGLNLSLLAEQLDERAEPRVVTRLQRVRAETSRLGVILEDFLRYAGRMEPDLERLDAGRLVREVGDFFQPQAAVREVTLDVEVSDGPLPVLADESLLKQAVLNLALNAVQHTPPGGRVTLAAARGPAGVTLGVADTGQGIDPAEHAKLFDAYYSRRKGGTGLGLAMVKRIADAHHGTISVDSTPGRGSTFTLTLPATS